MKFKTFSFIIVCALLTSSCKHLQKTTATPQLPEINSTTEITVRTESVRPIDASERALYGYYVIIGSFRSVDNAQQYNADMVSKGFSPVILESENGLFRISVGGYNDENVARARIAAIRARYEEHGDVWLLVRR